MRMSHHQPFSDKVAAWLQLLLFFTASLTYACPSDCICKWKGGKQSVECLNRGLRTFPSPMDPGTQVLDLAGNSFETLPPEHFKRLGLINLQKIHLSKCKLSHISQRTFSGLSNLVDLDLSNNALREVPTGAFPDCQGLMRLILSANPITHLQRNAFINLKSLTSLEISNSAIEVVERGAFDDLLRLEWLKLSGNKLKRISGLSGLPLGLKGIWLEDNPWECDCRLLELRSWLAERNVANSVEPRCLSPPRLTNTSLKDLSIDNFACLPKLSPVTMYQKIGEGKNVSLLCKVISVPEATIEWWFNGQAVTNSSYNMVVETSTYSSFSSSSSSSLTFPTGSDSQMSSSYSDGRTTIGATTSSYVFEPYTSSSSGGGGSVSGFERRSELMVLNATLDESGTYLCVARNLAGATSANFTLKVLVRAEETGFTLETSMTSLVSSIPNGVVIIVSTVCAVGAVIILFVLILVICKCRRLCRKNGGHSGRSGGRKGNSNHSSSRSIKESKEGGGSGCAGKLNRHLSEASNLTTTTKSNGSVFLLSSSSELGIGDSNPDLIEGVKRVEGDGHEIAFSNNFSNNTTAAVYSTVEPAANPATSLVDPNSFHHPSVAYPLDYGLPAKTSYGTLVRRSPSSAYNSNNTPPPQQPTILSIPDNYDLAKYPKEYISTSPLTSLYHLPPGMVVQPGAGSPSPMYSTATQLNQQLHHHHHHQAAVNQYYPAGPYVVAPDGTFLAAYNPQQQQQQQQEDYYISMAMGHHHHMHQGQPPPAAPDNMIQINPGGSNCTCTTIPEQCEEEKAAETSSATHETESIIMSSGKNDTQPNPSTITHKRMMDAQDPSSAPSQHSSPSTHNGNPPPPPQAPAAETGIVARLQRQLKATTNESPDEGYEDESAEGTEI